MKVIDFVSSIYLGDRVLNKILIDSEKREISFEVDLISRIRSVDGMWNFYDKEDIENGSIVLINVSSFSMSPSHLLPNDQINFFTVSVINGGYNFKLSVDSILENGQSEEVIIEVCATEIGLKDINFPYGLITN